jgi:O-antigen/teichoic acid export membrane protein
MGRVRVYLGSVATGHLLIVTNLGYSLASVPLALHFLSVERFGLWAVALQIAGFFLLLDTGISSALGRLLIDVKDRRPSPDYGEMFFAALLVLGFLAAVVMLAGTLFAAPLVRFMDIPPELQHDATMLLWGQVLISALSLPARAVGNTIMAHARYDLLNSIFIVSQVLAFFALAGTLWIGAGIFSLLFASGANLGVTVVGAVWVSHRLRFLPAANEWRRPRSTVVWEVLGYGQNIFLNQVGGMFLNASPSILLAKFAGLPAAAAWAVGSKMFLFTMQFGSKFFESSSPVFAEMFVRREFQKFLLRLGQLQKLSLALGLVGGAALWALNSNFIDVWTGGRISWLPSWDLLLLILATLRMRNFSSAIAIGATKDFGLFRFCYLLEAGVFILLGCWLIPGLQVGGLLLAAVAANALITTPYLVMRDLRRPLQLGIPVPKSRFEFTMLLLLLPVGAAFFSHVLWQGMIPFGRLLAAGTLQALCSLPALWAAARLTGGWEFLRGKIAGRKGGKPEGQS